VKVYKRIWVLYLIGVTPGRWNWTLWNASFYVFPTSTHLLSWIIKSMIFNSRGVALSNSKLSWNNHCSIITAKATRVLNIICRNLFGSSKEYKHGVFSALMLPILEYACKVWNLHTQKNIKQLQAIEHRGARWICGARYHRLNFRWSPPSVQCCVTLNWLLLSVRRKFFTILTVHDILHYCICLDFNNYFTISSIPTHSHSLSLFIVSRHL